MNDKLDVCSAAYVWLSMRRLTGGKVLKTLDRLRDVYRYTHADESGDLTDAAEAVYDSFDDVDDVINALEDAGVFS